MDVTTSGYMDQIVQNTLNQAGDSKVQASSHRPGKATPEKIAEKSKEFEAVFIAQMLKHMFAGIKTDEMFGGGHGEDVLKTMLLDEYGKGISKAGGIGIAEHVQKELIKLQEMGS